MARFFYEPSTDALVGSTRVEVDPAVLGVLPSALSVEFDEDTNGTLVADLLVSFEPYTYDGAVLRKNGTPITINPDGEAETDRKAIPNRKAQIETYMGLNDLPVPTDLPGGATLADVITRVNQLDALVQRTNANTNATQGIFQILRALAARFNWF